jgi:hypothetical protein
MTRWKTIMLTAVLFLGVGCAVEPDPAGRVSEPEVVAGEVLQEIGGGGGSCPAKDNCYRLCRLRFQCTSASSCSQLSQCLTRCDADFPTCQ